MEKLTNEEFKKRLIRKAYHYALNIIKLVDSLPNERSCWIIGDQLLRSATSIGANIIEAQAASSQKDFINFLSYALKSANESKFWLGLLRDSQKMEDKIINPLLKETQELGGILGSVIATLKGKRKI